jgi:tRNA threonylcarbamoyl adenosine modification protein YeaZ
MILGIDTANEAISLALGHPNGVVPVVSSLFAVRDMAERLTHEVDLLCAAAGITPQHITGVVCTVGPGGFSGVRVGLGYATGLAMGLKVPVYGISVHEALARGIKPRTDAPQIASIMVVQNAGRGMVYAQAFNNHCKDLTALHETTLAQVQQDLATLPHPICVTGNAAPLLTGDGLVLSTDMRVDVEVLLHLWSHMQQNADQYMPNAVYIRPPDAKLPSSAAQ